MEITYEDGFVRDSSEVTGDCLRLDRWTDDWEPFALLMVDHATASELDGTIHHDWIPIVDGEEYFCSAVGHMEPGEYSVPDEATPGWYRACILGGSCSPPFKVT